MRRSLLAAAIVTICIGAAAVNPPQFLGSSAAGMNAREAQVWASVTRQANFQALKQAAVATDCENVADPEAIATPNPLIDQPLQNHITLSFIIGIDGRVHSPLILQNSDDSQDATLLSIVSHWRYRPATCNGVPMESEGRVEFSHR